MNKIIIGSDHAGYELKEKLKKAPEFENYVFTDEGAFSPESVDYPDMISKVARAVSEGRFERGIAICGTGIGASIVANKFKHIRAALVGTVPAAVLSRQHNNSNILVLGARTTGFPEAVKIVEAWLTTGFEGGRHAVRLAKIENIEKENFK